MEFTNPSDIFDELPDPLLLLILSFMPTKDAFRTCLISKRWQRLSTLSDTFNFTCSSYDATEDFSFVDNALAYSLAPKIKKFQIDFTGRTDFWGNFRSESDSLLNRCFSFSVERQVEDVVLWLSGADEFTLPESLYTCSSLITLDVKFCGFDNHKVISWNSIKSIKLGFLVLADDEMVRLLAGCPALETMELYRYDGFRHLEINSRKLKTLKLKDYSWLSESGDGLEILAPYLQHLEISGDLFDLKCRLVDVSSLVTAKLIFNNDCIKDIPGFNEEDSCRDYHQVFYTLIQDNLQKLRYATELTLGTWFTQVMCMLQFKGVPVSELNCKYLTLELHMKKFNLYGVAGFLRASPNVEIVNMVMQTMLLDDCPVPFLDNSRCNSELLDLAKGDNVDLQSAVSSIEFHNLKKVQIVISSEQCMKDHLKWGFDKLSKLSEFLLMNASVLEKFVIISKRRRCRTCSMNCESQYLSRLACKLLGCPRSSTNSVIIFQERAFHDLTTNRNVTLY